MIKINQQPEGKVQNNKNNQIDQKECLDMPPPPPRPPPPENLINKTIKIAPAGTAVNPEQTILNRIISSTESIQQQQLTMEEKLKKCIENNRLNINLNNNSNRNISLLRNKSKAITILPQPQPQHRKILPKIDDAHNNNKHIYPIAGYSHQVIVIDNKKIPITTILPKGNNNQSTVINNNNNNNNHEKSINIQQSSKPIITNNLNTDVLYPTLKIAGNTNNEKRTLPNCPTKIIAIGKVPKLIQPKPKLLILPAEPTTTKPILNLPTNGKQTIPDVLNRKNETISIMNPIAKNLENGQTFGSQTIIKNTDQPKEINNNTNDKDLKSIAATALKIQDSENLIIQKNKKSITYHNLNTNSKKLYKILTPKDIQLKKSNKMTISKSFEIPPLNPIKPITNKIVDQIPTTRKSASPAQPPPPLTMIIADKTIDSVPIKPIRRRPGRPRKCETTKETTNRIIKKAISSSKDSKNILRSRYGRIVRPSKHKYVRLLKQKNNHQYDIKNNNKTENMNNNNDNDLDNTNNNNKDDAINDLLEYLNITKCANNNNNNNNEKSEINHSQKDDQETQNTVVDDDDDQELIDNKEPPRKRKRRLPDDFICNTCHKIYLGTSKINNHLLKHPDHVMKKPKLNPDESLTPNEQTSTSQSTSSTMIDKNATEIISTSGAAIPTCTATSTMTTTSIPSSSSSSINNSLKTFEYLINKIESVPMNEKFTIFQDELSDFLEKINIIRSRIFDINTSNDSAEAADSSKTEYIDKNISKLFEIREGNYQINLNAFKEPFEPPDSSILIHDDESQQQIEESSDQTIHLQPHSQPPASSTLSVEMANPSSSPTTIVKTTTSTVQQLSSLATSHLKLIQQTPITKPPPPPSSPILIEDDSIEIINIPKSTTTTKTIINDPVNVAATPVININDKVNENLVTPARTGNDGGEDDDDDDDDDDEDDVEEEELDEEEIVEDEDDVEDDDDDDHNIEDNSFNEHNNTLEYNLNISLDSSTKLNDINLKIFNESSNVVDGGILSTNRRNSITTVSYDHINDNAVEAIELKTTTQEDTIINDDCADDDDDDGDNCNDINKNIINNKMKMKNCDNKNNNSVDDENSDKKTTDDKNEIKDSQQQNDEQQKLSTKPVFLFSNGTLSIP